jgi:hypothetical protein
VETDFNEELNPIALPKNSEVENFCPKDMLEQQIRKINAK